MTRLLFIIILATSPLFLLAADLEDLIADFSDIVGLLLSIGYACAFLAFAYGMSKFVLHSGSGEGIEDGKRLMKWGIIALFVLTSVWGIIRFIQGEFNFSDVNVGGLPLRDDPQRF